MSQITPRLADARRALDAADRVRADGQALVDEGRQLAKQGSERIRSADPQYWTAARLVHDELTQTPITQQQAADMLGRSRSYVSRLYSIGKTFTGRDPQAEGLTFDAAYRQAQEVSDYGIGREKLAAVLGSAPASLTQSDMAGQTGLAQSTVSEYLKQMITEGLVQKGPGRPARYELAPDRPSDVRREQPAEDGHREPGDGTPAPARPEDRAHEDAGDQRAAEPMAGPEPELEDAEGRRRLDVREILRYLDGRILREAKAGRLVPAPDERRMLVDVLTASAAAFRDQSQITRVPADGRPDAGAVAAALVPLARQLRWASASGQHSYFTDGATVWVVVASTRAAIIRERNGKIAACPSDVSAHWLLARATKG
jgi:predicted transcriptional regulator